MSFSPGSYNIRIPQNGTYLDQLTYKDSSGNVVDLTGFTARMQVVDSSNNPVILLSTGNGLITLGNASPNIVLTIPLATLETLTCANGRYDLVLDAPGGTFQTVLLAGSFIIVPGVTP